MIKKVANFHLSYITRLKKEKNKLKIYHFLSYFITAINYVFYVPILSNLVIIKTWKEKKKKKNILIYIFGYPFGFVMTGYLISSTSLKTVVIYQKPVLVIVWGRDHPHTTVGGSLFLGFLITAHLLVGGGKGQDFLSGRFFTFFMKKNLRFQFKHVHN